MKKKIGFLMLGLLIIVIISNLSRLKLVNRYYLNPCYYDSPVKQKDFPQIFFDINLGEYYSQIMSISDPEIRIDTVEQISYKGQSYPILEITKEAESASRKLLIFAGIHGNESGGTLAILKLLKDLVDDPSKYEEWEMKIVTPVNPAGTVEMSRYNEYGCDLNRKVKTSNQKGIVIQRRIIESFKPEIIVTLHEAPSSGFLIHPGKYLSEDLIDKLLKEVTDEGIELSTEDYLGRTLPQSGVSAVKGGLKFLKNLAQVQTLGDYLGEKNIIEITTESGWNSQDTFQRVDSHFFLIRSLIKNYQGSNID